ncbi:16S rRNA (guanine(527)-N(7))-methyltransferase RsmG [Cellulomonas massiliensis]|uniref:16S rRNA (guanine(527)-N(7))-methyltransferase RsmG n=1 Tax=Cellulomonas massiliensis TaxID=1465811 RepID=UPI0003778613|nr:16S rRNA (guanine(527)-N(7))-methyltransferase RsmG [Cellulomonas massiliensis]
MSEAPRPPDESEAADDPWEGDDRLPEYFGPAWDRVSAFRRMLVSDGVLRGLVGPREVGRLWERHLLNSAAVVPFLPDQGDVVDVGSGAGLPGVVIACMRPDQRIVLLEPMERRVDWLREVVDALALPHVEVVRGRAPEIPMQANVVTARAVAGLEKLYRWTVPLLRPGGTLVALKGARAADEVEASSRLAARLGLRDVEVLTASTLPGAESTTIVRAVRR